MTMEELNTALSSLVGGNVQWVDNSLLASMSDGTDVYLEYLCDRDELYMYGHIASISEERFGKYAVSLLKANLFGQETGGSAVLAYDADESRVVLWDKVGLAATGASEFKERFSYIYLSILHWANKMRQDLLGDAVGFGVPRSAIITG